MQPQDTSPQVGAEIEVIPADQARAAIQAAIVAQLGPDWADEDQGWLKVHDSDYLVRLTRRGINMDFHCDLLGAVSVTEQPANPLQTSGRLIAWMLLGASMLLALALAWASGFLR